MIRTLIVDDEPIGRRVLHDELDEFADVAVVGEAANGAMAVDLIQRLTPDLVFLDLQMPVLGGIELIGRLPPSRPPAIIVVSACEECSLIALRAGAVGYLLKPVSPASLRRAIDLLQTRPIGRAASRMEGGHRDPEFLVSSECRHHINL